MAEHAWRGEVGRLIRTLWHLRSGQVVWRLRGAVRRRVWHRYPHALCQSLGRRARSLLPVLWDSPALGQFATFRRERAGLRLSQAEGVLDNRFVLVNRTFEFAERLNWHREDIRRETPLAGFELHYQSHLEDLALAWESTRDRKYVAKWQELIRSWIQGNPPQGTDFARFSWSPRIRPS